MQANPIFLFSKMMFYMSTKDAKFLFSVFFTAILCFSHCVHSSSPITCNTTLATSCPAMIYYTPKTTETIQETSLLFHVSPDSINQTANNSFLISGTCSCLGNPNYYSWHVDYTVKHNDTWDKVASRYGNLVAKELDKTLVPGTNITLDILCGCFQHLNLFSYGVQRGDTLYMICSQFRCNVDQTAKLNQLGNPDSILAGDVLFIPISGRENVTLPDNNEKKAGKDSKLSLYLIVGIVLGVVVGLLFLVLFVFRRCYYKRKEHADALSFRSEHSVAVSLYSDKATEFTYNEVSAATSNFSLSLKIGQGSYGSVYKGKLKGTDVAIKQMKNTKSKEFFSELGILCKVKHPNLIELIGYAIGGDSLFLVYEFAQNGALSDHLYNPIVKGHQPLTWIDRVQIALDAAKGLEHIHVHTRPFYVHRDVKTSNILLDSKFRAKVADFGLVKLLERPPEVGTTASRIVGTLGYLAPEYIRDGCVTTKSDVYGFGVVLMEMLIGQPPLSRDASPINAEYSIHRSLVDYVLAVLENDDPLVKLTQNVDPNLSDYHEDSLLQMALLSRDCVDEDWNRRPDICKVVLRLTGILACSQEWEKLERI